MSTPPEVCTLAVAAIGVGYSPRLERLDEKHVRALLEVIDQLPPIIVDKSTMTVIDGIPRLKAHRRTSRPTIRAILFSGDDTEVLALAIRANVGHGKPLTLNERETAAAALLRRCPERSDRWIAQVCALSHSTVGSVRKAVTAEGPPVRIGQDGRRRSVTPAGTLARHTRRERDPRHDANKAGINTSPGRTGEAPSSSRGGLPTTEVTQPAEDLASHGGGAERPPQRNIVFLRGRSEQIEWFDRTSIAEEDLGPFLHEVPLAQVPEIVDECRRRARLWDQLAEGLDSRQPTHADKRRDPATPGNRTGSYEGVSRPLCAPFSC